MTEQIVDFVITSEAPTDLGAPPPGQEAMSFSYGVAAGQDSSVIVHYDQIGRVVTAFAPFGLAVALDGYMAMLPGWVALRIVHTEARSAPYPTHQEYDYPTLYAALHQAGFRETIHPPIE